MTRQIHVGDVAVGGGAPVSIQSMLNTRTTDVAGSLAQIARLRDAGCQIVRLAVPGPGRRRGLRRDCRRNPRCRWWRTSTSTTGWPFWPPRAARRRFASTPATSATPGTGPRRGRLLPRTRHPHPRGRQRRFAGEVPAGEIRRILPPRRWWRAPWATSQLLESVRLSRYLRVHQVLQRPADHRGLPAAGSEGGLPAPSGRDRDRHRAHGRHQVRHGHRLPALRRHRRHHPRQPDGRPGARRSSPRGRFCRRRACAGTASIWSPAPPAAARAST